MAGYKMDDYVDVAERINEFYKRFPEGRLVTGITPFVLDIGSKSFLVYNAKAYRDPSDELPGDGWAWEPVPGPTQFTKDSELMNAETAAWGRAIVALGFSTKKIASAQEVRARTGRDPNAGAPGGARLALPAVGGDAGSTSEDAGDTGTSHPVSPPSDVPTLTDGERRKMFKAARDAGLSDEQIRDVIGRVTGQSSTAQIPRAKLSALLTAIGEGT